MRRSEYPYHWPSTAKKVKEEAGWQCIRCGHPHDPSSGYCLTVHHFTLNKQEPSEHWWAFLALCQRCHLQVQSKVDPEVPWFLEHSDWIKPYMAGFYAHKYEGRNITREEAVARMDELLGYELKTA